MAELISCKTEFSNGSEYEWFLEHNCDCCTRFRNGQCRIFNLMEKARFDEKYFPYNELMDYKDYAGKVCKKFTNEKPTRKRSKKQIDGQTELVLC